MDTYKFARIFVTVLVFIICLCLVYVFFSRTKGGQVAVREILDTARQSISIAKPDSCGVVFGSCELEIRKEDAICNPAKLAEEVRKEAANPMASAACVKALEKMKSQCQASCSLASDTLINVPGEISVEISYQDPTTNNNQILSPGIKIPEVPCTAIGKRTVNLKADCG